MTHPKAVGDRTTLAVMLAFQAAGYSFLMPFGENTRYDLALDEGHRLARVQCKTGRLRNGGIRFSVCSMYLHHPNPKISFRDYHDDVDYFALYCPETDGVYLVPIEDLPVRQRATLRCDPPRNRQRERIRLADPYLIGSVTVSAGARAALAGRAGGGAPCA